MFISHTTVHNLSSYHSCMHFNLTNIDIISRNCGSHRTWIIHAQCIHILTYKEMIKDVTSHNNNYDKTMMTSHDTTFLLSSKNKNEQRLGTIKRTLKNIHMNIHNDS